ncbi:MULTISPECIES: ABC transporter permease [Anaerolinea]|uniref:ABC transporter permease n=1 Tax=Anaerolinea TaxID=233189 RepID=UPI002606CDFD|nr:ABC transporter permease [Anaerolinea thermophila]
MSKALTLLVDLIDVPKTVATLVRFREAIRILTWRDFRARYRGSIFGILWAVAQPLLMMLAYTLVFSYFLKVRFGSTDSPTVFAVYLLCGLVPWNAFSEGVNASCSLMRLSPNLVKKVVFPLEVLPVNLTLVTMIQQLIGLALLLILVLAVGGGLNGWVLLLPFFLLVQFMLQTGLSWLLASLSVFIPDFRQATGLFTLLLMFITPIFYPETLIPERLRFLVTLNPMAQIVGMYRRVLMEGLPPTLEQIAWAGGMSLLFWMVGYVWFTRTKHAFPDYL